MKFQEFVNWALKQGSVAKFNDNDYMGECVSLINQYCWRVLDIPADAWGDAKDWAYNAMPMKYFDKVTDPREGNILVYGADFGDGRGHIEIVLNETEAIGQNRNNSRAVGYGQIIPGYIAVLRLKQEYVKKELAQFVPMDKPEIRIAGQDLHKFDPDTKTFASEVTLPGGTIRKFEDKVIVDGKEYLRTKHDKNRGIRLGFDKAKLKKLPPIEEIVKVMEEAN